MQPLDFGTCRFQLSARRIEIAARSFEFTAFGFGACVLYVGEAA